jgi:hypothetical protein
MKSNTFLALTIIGTFLIGYWWGKRAVVSMTYKTFKYVDLPEEIEAVSHDPNHTDLFQGAVVRDTLFFQYVPK